MTSENIMVLLPSSFMRLGFSPPPPPAWLKQVHFALNKKHAFFDAMP